MCVSMATRTFCKALEDAVKDDCGDGVQGEAEAEHGVEGVGDCEELLERCEAHAAHGDVAKHLAPNLVLHVHDA